MLPIHQLPSELLLYGVLGTSHELTERDGRVKSTPHLETLREEVTP
jgi:hypothetical protein